MFHIQFSHFLAWWSSFSCQMRCYGMLYTANITADVSSSTDLTQCRSIYGALGEEGDRRRKRKEQKRLCREAHIAFIQTTRKLSHTNSKSLQICFGAEDHHSKEFHTHSRKDWIYNTISKCINCLSLNLPAFTATNNTFSHTKRRTIDQMEQNEIPSKCECMENWHRDLVSTCFFGIMNTTTTPN